MDDGVLVFMRGVILGLSIAAPVGPIGVVCIRRTLSGGRWMGLISGLGAATADAVYGLVAALGLALSADALARLQSWLQLFGGAFLCYLGVRAFLDRPEALGELSVTPSAAMVPGGARRSEFAGAYASTFALTLANPITILSFVAIYMGLGLSTASAGALAPALLVLGVFVGSVLWWFILSSAASMLRGRLSPRGMLWVNRVSGVVILAFGVVTLWTALWRQS